jgi:HSP20 family protein
MTINDLIPWKKSEKLPVRRQEANSIFQLNNDFNRIFESFFENPWSLRPFDAFEANLNDFMPRLDVNETDKEMIVSVELPGMDEKDIQISLEEGVLTISGEKKIEKQEKSHSFHRMERSYGSFTRQVALPVDVDEDAVSATFKNGLLNVTLPKKQLSLSQGKRITVKKG